MPPAARIQDQVTHTARQGWSVGGLVGGALVGVGAVLLTVGTGGTAAVFIGAAATGGSLGGGIGGFLGSKVTSPIGPIIERVGTVEINGRVAARAVADQAACASHGAIPIAQGSLTVTIEGYPAARVGDMGCCAFIIGEGSSNVLIGGGQGTFLDVEGEMPWHLEWGMHLLGLVGAGGLLKAAGYGVARIGAILAGGEIGGQVGGRLGGTPGAIIGGALGGAGAARIGRPPLSPSRPTFRGTDKPWKEGATPNSKYVHVDPRTGKAKQTAIYNEEGKVVAHVDWKNHGQGAESGHGHIFPEPGNPASGHGRGKPHIPHHDLPPDYRDLPSGVEPQTPIGK